MTTKNMEQFFRTLQTQVAQLLLTDLNHEAHVFALKDTLFALDSKAKKIFEERLAIEIHAQQARREELHLMLSILERTPLGKPN